uniref:Uncharacterized protein n=1 Tax=Caenorhabditis japonica TaxID=281687 RepID=A0A8R1IZN6_CAEJA
MCVCVIHPVRIHVLCPLSKIFENELNSNRRRLCLLNMYKKPYLSEGRLTVKLFSSLTLKLHLSCDKNWFE